MKGAARQARSGDRRQKTPREEVSTAKTGVHSSPRPISPANRKRLKGSVVELLETDYYRYFIPLYEYDYRVTGTLPAAPNNQIRMAFTHLAVCLNTDTLEEAEQHLRKGKLHILNASLLCLGHMILARMDVLSDTVDAASQDKLSVPKETRDHLITTFRSLSAHWRNISAYKEATETVFNEFAIILTTLNNLYIYVRDNIDRQLLIDARCEALWKRAGRKTEQNIWLARAERDFYSAAHDEKNGIGSTADIIDFSSYLRRRNNNDFAGQKQIVELIGNSSYDIGTMETPAAAIIAVAAAYGLPVNEVRQAIEDLAAKSARHTTRRVKAKRRPAWDARKGVDLKLTPPEFILKYFSNEIATGNFHKGVIYSSDRGLYTKLNNWLQNPANELPEELDLPTKSEWLQGKRTAKAQRRPRQPSASKLRLGS